MPSSVKLGGIRMSVRTTSGSCSSTAASADGRSEHSATTSMPLSASASRREIPSRTMRLSSASATRSAMCPQSTRTVVRATPDTGRRARLPVPCAGASVEGAMASLRSVHLPAGRRWTVRGLVALATVLVVVGIFAVFANRQVLNEDNWSDTSTDLLANSAIRTAVTNTLVDNLYANVNVQAQVARSLPPRLRGLSGPAANGLQSLAEQRINRFLGRPAVQDVWKQANRLTAQQFINIAEGKSGAITSQGNAVILDLRVMLVNLARRLGLPGTLVGKIPPGAARIKILSASQVSTLQDGANLLRGLSVVLPALALILYGLAVYLARGRRRETLMATGACIVIAGAVVLIARNLIGNSVVDSLAKTDAVKPAAEAAWSIGTRMLHDVAQAV